MRSLRSLTPGWWIGHPFRAAYNYHFELMLISNHSRGAAVPQNEDVKSQPRAKMTGGMTGGGAGPTQANRTQSSPIQSSPTQSGESQPGAAVPQNCWPPRGPGWFLIIFRVPLGFVFGQPALCRFNPIGGEECVWRKGNNNLELISNLPICCGRLQERRAAFSVQNMLDVAGYVCAYFGPVALPFVLSLDLATMSFLR